MDWEQWKAISRHDGNYDGKLFYGLKKGEVVCCPSWDIGHIEPDKIVVFTSIEEAKKFGYRLCKRCKPEDSHWKGAKVDIARKAQELINRTFTEKFDLSAISGRLFVNGSYLCRVFKRETGKTLLQYCNEVRCNYAKELLTHSELCVAYIAAQAGFSNSSQFCHVFRRIVGKTPCQYRKDYFRTFESSTNFY